MSEITIKTAGESEFFRRGKRLGKLADAGQRLSAEHVVSCEDPADMLSLLTPARPELQCSSSVLSATTPENQRKVDVDGESTTDTPRP